MIISIYLGPLNGSPIDSTHVETGNPGVGGTQYCMLELAHYLNNNEDYHVNVLANRQYILEDGLSYFHVSGDDEICEVAKNIDTDILILSQFNSSVLEENIKHADYKVVIWSHNYILSSFCRFISETPQVVCNVFVGKQMYDRYIDDDVIKKSIYIYNMYTDKFPEIQRENDSKTVIYMGAIIPGKGFLELCRIWNKVIERVHDAKLVVLGSGNLYGDAKLGKLGIASEEYERQFSTYITDGNGDIIPSVKFLGVVGNGKQDIFRKGSVGVVNPSGRTETFGMGVLEMGEAKLPVVTIGKNGYFDTVISGKTGLLSKSSNKLVDDIVFLLTHPKINNVYGENSKENNKRFHPEVIGPQWTKLLNGIYHGDYSFEKFKPSRPMSNNQKWVRNIISVLRFNLGLSFIPSIIRVESFVFSRLRHN